MAIKKKKYALMLPTSLLVFSPSPFWRLYATYIATTIARIQRLPCTQVERNHNDERDLLSGTSSQKKKKSPPIFILDGTL